MRIRSRHWLIALLIAIVVHLALLFALIPQEPSALVSQQGIGLELDDGFQATTGLGGTGAGGVAGPANGAGIEGGTAIGAAGIGLPQQAIAISPFAKGAVDSAETDTQTSSRQLASPQWARPVAPGEAQIATSVIEPEPAPDIKLEPELKPEPKPRLRLEFDPEPEPKLKLEPKAKSQLKLEPTPPQKQDPLSKPEPEPQPKSLPQPQPKPQRSPSPPSSPSSKRKDGSTESASRAPNGSRGIVSDAASGQDSKTGDSHGAGDLEGLGGSLRGSLGGSGGSGGSDGSRGSADKESTSNYYGRLATWLARHKRYPAQARRLRQEGTVKVSFTIARNGRLLSSRIIESSGYPLLDQEVEAMLKRASPLPRIPASLGRSSLTVTLPVAFALR
jgi:protein TonB